MQLEWFTNEIKRYDVKHLLQNLFYSQGNPLLFNSGLFLFLFTLFFVFYTLIYSKKKLRNFWVIAFSLYFYYKTSGTAIAVLAGSVFVNYFLALLLYELNSKKIKKSALIVTIILNVVLLCYFKYINFFLANLSFASGINFGNLEILFPIGISFFTFQTLSYQIDVYRGTIKPTYRFFDYTFYITFFPYIIAGPIVRAGDFLRQNSNNLRIKREDINNGIYLIVRGLIKKAVLALYLGQYCDLIYGMPGNYSGFENLIAMYAYAFQIYFDFSGYSDIAIGLASLMGFKLKDNFNKPYISINIIEFWRRWHISLSTWLRDYLFLPLTYSRLNRKKNKFLIVKENIQPSWKWDKSSEKEISSPIKLPMFSTYIYSTMITMLIAGFWHGASWTFVFWGVMHGIALCANKFYQVYISKKIKPKHGWVFYKKYISKFIAWLITFNFISILWIFFRAGTMEDALISINSIITNFDIAYLSPFYIARTLFSILFIISFILILFPGKYKIFIERIFHKTPFIIKAVIFILVLQLIIQLQTENVQPFIYSRF